MKQVVLVCAVLLFPLFVDAETVASVSFNPSRMGEYTYLKVADKASLKGGLNAATMNISSGGTVTMNADSSSRIYEVPTVTGASGSAINMPNTVFHGNTSNTYSAYKSESSSAPSGLLPNVNIKGGTQTYNNDSYIQTLDAVNMLKQKVGSLKGGTLEITGNNGSAVSLYETGNTAGFHLAGNDIPEPTSAHTNTNSNLTGCQLAWEKRKTSESPAKEVYLLALQGCNGAATPPNPGGDCDNSKQTACTSPSGLLTTAGIWNSTSCTCTCPLNYSLSVSGQCSREISVGPSEPIQPTYKWVLTNQGLENNVGPNTYCFTTCMMTSSVNFSSGLPSTLAANAFSPTCQSSNVGRTCNPGGPYTISGNKYCPTYTCRAQ